MNLVDGLEGVLAFHEEIKVQTCNKLELRAKCLGSFQFLYTKKNREKGEVAQGGNFSSFFSYQKSRRKEKKNFRAKKNFLLST
jgi:hypothetical protein